jgi:hypothetical protein
MTSYDFQARLAAGSYESGTRRGESDAKGDLPAAICKGWASGVALARESPKSL